MHTKRCWSAFARPLLVWKSNKYYVFWVCVVALGIQHAIRHIVICALPRSAVFFHIISFRSRFSGGKKVYWTQNMCFDFLYRFVWNISHSENDLARYRTCTLIFTYPLSLSDFNETWIFGTDFFKNNQMINFMKISGLGSEVFHPEGQTDRHDKANSRFSLLLLLFFFFFSSSSSSFLLLLLLLLLLL